MPELLKFRVCLPDNSDRVPPFPGCCITFYDAFECHATSEEQARRTHPWVGRDLGGIQTYVWDDEVKRWIFGMKIRSSDGEWVLDKEKRDQPQAEVAWTLNIEELVVTQEALGKPATSPRVIWTREWPHKNKEKTEEKKCCIVQ